MSATTIAPPGIAPPGIAPPGIAPPGMAPPGEAATAASPFQAPVPAGAPAPPLRWDGSAGRLVGIGLGNMALTVLTLGLYRFWGTVRMRRHLWAHQEFLGGRLE